MLYYPIGIGAQQSEYYYIWREVENQTQELQVMFQSVETLMVIFKCVLGRREEDKEKIINKGQKIYSTRLILLYCDVYPMNLFIYS